MPSRSILITGASSGLGAALALRCAQAGATLHLSGRNEARLRGMADACRAKGALVYAEPRDVQDRSGMNRWIESIGHLDLVIANAGVSAGTMGAEIENEEQIRAIFSINLDGVLNTVLPALRIMKQQPLDAGALRGRIGVVASIAAFLAPPGAPSYCASKAAVDRWAIATAPAAKRQGVSITSLCPGYIRTPMTDKNKFAMPGLMEPDDVARRMLAAIDRAETRFTTPLWLASVAKILNLLPPALLNHFMQRVAGKDENSKPL